MEDCLPVICPPNYTGTNKLIGTQNSNAEYKTDGEIASEQIIDIATVTYNAGTSICLLPGFEAKSGTVFTAYIEGCWTMLQEEVAETYFKELPIEENNTFTDNQSLTVYPNPTSSAVTVAYNIDKATEAYIYIVDFSGKLVGAFEIQNLAQGTYYQNIEFGANFSPGLYQVVLQTDNEVLTEKVIYQQR